MEIISYNYSAYGDSQNRKSFKFRKPSNPQKNGFSQEYSIPSEAFSLHELWADVKGAFSNAAHFISSAAKYFWLIPALAAVCSVPFIVSRILEKSESQAVPVTFPETDDQLMDYLDSLMSQFALQQAQVDENGNLLDSQISPEALAVTYKQPVSFQTYTVKNGDTISGIASKFGLSNISTLIAVNSISNVRSIVVGQKLQIPSMDGLYYTVASGDTLASIASKYNAKIGDILDVNDLSTDVLSEGTKLYIPGAKLDSKILKKAMGETAKYICPIGSTFRITSLFGPRKDPITGAASNHKGVDLACSKGTPVKASADGTVAVAGWSNLYGNYVILTHEDGYQTLYGHMSKILVKRGETVKQGTKVGLVGSTGYSTGPHLHFTVYKNGSPVDPMSLVKISQ